MWRRGLPLSKPFDLTVLLHPVNHVTISVASAVRIRTCTYSIAYNGEVQRCALAMKTTLSPHLRLGPYKGSVNSVQNQMPFHAVGRSFRPSGGS